MDITCKKCNKEFANSFSLKRHKNRKNPCFKNDTKLKCDLCNSKFRCNKEKERHEETNKHIKNISIKGNNNTTIVDSYNTINQYFNNNITINFPLNTFKNSNLDLIQDYHLKEYLNKISIHIINRANLENEKTLCTIEFIKCIISIIKELNFNFEDIQKFQNNNIKLLFFLNKYVRNTNFMQYLIFDINSNDQLIWKEITYSTFIKELFSLMDLIRNKFDLEKLNFIMNYLDTHFRNNQELIEEYKEPIESLLKPIYKKIDQIPDPTHMADLVKKEILPYNGNEYDIEYLSISRDSII